MQVVVCFKMEKKKKQSASIKDFWHIWKIKQKWGRLSIHFAWTEAANISLDELHKFFERKIIKAW